MNPSDLKTAARELGARGGHKRAAVLTPEQRSEIARRASLFRHHGECPFCGVEPGTAEHLGSCEGTGA